MNGSIMDRIVDAENMVNIILKRTQSKKPTAPQMFAAIQTQMQINALYELAQAVEIASGRPPISGVARDAYDWKLAHPDEWYWILANSERSPFADSLNRSLNTFGKLTDAQLAKVQEILKGGK